MVFGDSTAGPSSGNKKSSGVGGNGNGNLFTNALFQSREKLQNDIFCLTEERDYFQMKFLEQVSEISALKEELKQSKKEIIKLRQEILELNGEDELGVDVVDIDQVNIVATTPDSTADGSGHHQRRPSRRKTRYHDKDDNDDDLVDGDDDNDDDASSLTSDGLSPTKFKTPPPSSSLKKDKDGEDDDVASASSTASSHDSGKDIRQSAEKLLQWASYRTSTTPSSVAGSRATDRSRSSAITPTSISKTSTQQENVPQNHIFQQSPLLGKVTLKGTDSDAGKEEEKKQEEDDCDDDDNANVSNNNTTMLEKKTNNNGNQPPTSVKTPVIVNI